MAWLLSQVYNSVDDIDVYVGGLAVIPLAGSIAGPTLNCLITEQFNQIKFSDRYFYELGNQAHSFTAGTAKSFRNCIFKWVYFTSSWIFLFGFTYCSPVNWN